MKTYRRMLLIATPPGTGSPALREAAWLARRSGAALHILLADHSAALELVGRMRRENVADLHESFLHRRREALELQAAALRANGLSVTTEAVWTRRPAEEIIVHAVESGADLVLKDVRHDGGEPHVAPLDWSLLRRCPAPLLLVGSEHVSPKRVIAAVDVLAGVADPLNTRIVEHALALAYTTGAQAHLAYAFQAISPIDAGASMYAPPLSADVYESLYRIHRESFDAFADACSVPRDRRHFLDGAPARALRTLAAADGSDVFVMGTTHRGRVERVLMGSTAEAILDGLPGNMLVVKPDGLVDRLVEQAQAELPAAP